MGLKTEHSKELVEAKLKKCPFCGAIPSVGIVVGVKMGFIKHKSSCYLKEDIYGEEIIVSLKHWNRREGV